MRSITFPDAKRVFTKDVLMRIDLYKLALNSSKQYLEEQLEFLNNKYGLMIDLMLWNSFIKEMIPKKEAQMSVF